MPDFQRIVRERLRDSGLEPTRESEIVDELSQHLRDRYESQLSSGMNAVEAERTVLAELDGRDLAAELRGIEGRWREPVAFGSISVPNSGQRSGRTCDTPCASCAWNRHLQSFASLPRLGHRREHRHFSAD